MADTNTQREESDKRRSVNRWLYAGLTALALILGGTLLFRLNTVERLLGIAYQPGVAQQNDAQATNARESFQKTVSGFAKMDPKRDDGSLAKMAIPTGADGFFAPPLESEMPEKQDGEAIRRGREIFLNTGANATPYVGNSLACANCHLDAGRRANSAPMWAAAGLYPKYRGKNKQINTMEDRINGCFTYSMNAPGGPAGSAPPAGDQIYKDLESYFHWLATGAPNGVSLPGQGFPTLDKPAKAYDRQRGQKIFAEKCSVCHGENGQGRQDANGRYAFPPLWGPDSFNWGAGMHRVNTAAGFIYANMPLGQPFSLTTQEAWDVAAYINSHERPPDPRQPDEGLTTAAADAQYHEHPCYYGDEIDGQVVGAGISGVPSTTPAATGTVVPPLKHP